MSAWQTVWHGAPRTKKNSQRICVGGSRIRASKAFEAYAIAIDRERYLRGRPLFEGRVSVKALYWIENDIVPDLVGLLQGTLDLLEGVAYYDDVQVAHMDGSRIVGVDRKDPRVEITVFDEGPLHAGYAVKKVRSAFSKYWGGALAQKTMQSIGKDGAKCTR